MVKIPHVDPLLLSLCSKLENSRSDTEQRKVRTSQSSLITVIVSETLVHLVQVQKRDGDWNPYNKLGQRYRHFTSIIILTSPIMYYVKLITTPIQTTTKGVVVMS